MFGAGLHSKIKRTQRDSRAKYGQKTILKINIFFKMFFSLLPFSAHFPPKSSFSVFCLCFHSFILPSDIPLPPPPCLCGMDCFTSAVLTLTAPSLWRLISCSDTLSLYHANGPAHPPGCVYAISTLSKTPENRERQIRETYTHTHHTHRHLSCLVYV